MKNTPNQVQEKSTPFTAIDFELPTKNTFGNCISKTPFLSGKSLDGSPSLPTMRIVIQCGLLESSGESSLPSFHNRTRCLSSELNTAASSVTLPFEARKFSRSFKCGRSRYASISRQAVYRASARQLPAYWTPFSRQHLIYVLF